MRPLEVHDTSPEDGNSATAWRSNGADRRGHQLEYEAIVRAGWAAFHGKKQHGQVPGNVLQKMRVLHYGVRHHDMGGGHSTLVGPGTARIAKAMYPGAHEAQGGKLVPDRRGSMGMLRETHNEMGQGPAGSGDRLRLRRRDGCLFVGVGPATRPEQRTGFSNDFDGDHPSRRSAWLRERRCVVCTTAGRVRLQRGHRRLGRRRWDDSLQAHIDNATGETVPRKRKEECFVARIARKQVSCTVGAAAAAAS